MKEVETKDINSATHPLQPISTINQHIPFTQETPIIYGSTPFLDILFSLGPDYSLITTIYRKPTHTDKDLHWDRQHNLSARYSMLNNLTFRTRRVCVNPQLLHKEEELQSGASTLDGSSTDLKPRTTISSATHRPTTVPGTITQTTTRKHSNIHMVVPYTKSLSKSSKSICGEVGIQVHFKDTAPSKASW